MTTAARKPWRCPGCSKRFRIPAASREPALCPECHGVLDGAGKPPRSVSEKTPQLDLLDGCSQVVKSTWPQKELRKNDGISFRVKQFTARFRESRAYGSTVKSLAVVLWSFIVLFVGVGLYQESLPHNRSDYFLSDHSSSDLQRLRQQTIDTSTNAFRDELAWYAGGTLHDATMHEWRTASYSNRLATCADFVAGAIRLSGEEYPGQVKLKPMAIALEKAISEAGADGHADNQKVATISAVLLKLASYGAAN